MGLTPFRWFERPPNVQRKLKGTNQLEWPNQPFLFFCQLVSCSQASLVSCSPVACHGFYPLMSSYHPETAWSKNGPKKLILPWSKNPAQLSPHVIFPIIPPKTV